MGRRQLMNCNPIKISSSSPPRIHPDFCFLASTAYHMMIVKTPSTSPVAWKISHLLSQFLSHLASGWQVTSSHYGHLLSGPSIRVPFLFPRWKYPFGGFKHYSTGKSDALHLDKSPNYEDQKVTVEHGDIVVEPRLMSRYLFFHLILRLRWVDLELPGPFSQAIKASARGVSKVLMPHLQMGSWCFFMVTPPTTKQSYGKMADVQKISLLKTTFFHSYATNYQTVHPPIMIQIISL